MRFIKLFRGFNCFNHLWSIYFFPGLFLTGYCDCKKGTQFVEVLSHLSEPPVVEIDCDRINSIPKPLAKSKKQSQIELQTRRITQMFDLILNKNKEFPVGESFKKRKYGRMDSQQNCFNSNSSNRFKFNSILVLALIAAISGRLYQLWLESESEFVSFFDTFKFAHNYSLQ